MLSSKIEKSWLTIFYCFGALLLVTLLTSVYLESFYLLLIPSALLFVFLSINDMKFVYLLLLFTIPLSIEVQLPNGFATDFPTEILIGGMMILFIALALSNPKAFDIRVLKNPILFLIVIHFAWIIVATFYSSDAFVSIKYSLAKTWYIVTFVFVTSVMIRSVDDFKKAFWWLLLPLLFTMIYTMIRHSKTDFSFQTVNTPMLPFFRNHVNYACTIAQMIPLTFLAISWYKKGTLKKNFLILSLLFMLVAVYFSYTRSAWLALFTAAVVIIVVRLRLMKLAITFAVAGSIGFFVYMSYHNHYLDHSPDFESTIYHPELGEHLASTFEGKDISSAERIYRWVAGVRMWIDKPWIGYGPGNFYNFYKSYTVNSFTTYVSDNPEHSSIHNYFLLVLAEQGIFGLLIFLALTICIFVNGQRIYHQTISSKEKHYVLAVLLCMVIIYVNTFLSDLLETDKIGSFYFICIALLINQDIRNKDAMANKSPAVSSVA